MVVLWINVHRSALQSITQVGDRIDNSIQYFEYLCVGTAEQSRCQPNRLASLMWGPSTMDNGVRLSKMEISSFYITRRDITIADGTLACTW